MVRSRERDSHRSDVPGSRVDRDHAARRHRAAPGIGRVLDLALVHRLHSTPLFDRDGWFRGLHEETRRPYPDELRQAIISLNRPLLRISRASYRHQIALALTRDDLASVQHRVTALLASVFDIVFAANWALHPGEKRQLSQFPRLDPGGAEGVSRHVHDLIRAACNTERRSVLQAIDNLCDDVDSMITSTGGARSPH